MSISPSTPTDADADADASARTGATPGSWRQLWRAYVGKDRESAEIRASHLQSVMALSPFAMVANVANGALLWFVMRDQVSPMACLAWWAMLCAVCGLGLWAWWGYRKRERSRVSPKLMIRSSLHAAALAAVWAVVPPVLFPIGSTSQQVLIAALIPGMIAGGALVLFPLPLSALSYVAILGLSSVAALSHSALADAPVIGLLLLIYTALVMFASLGAARRATVGLCAEREADRQSQLVGLLLRDFESQSADVMWETDAAGHLTRAGAKLLGLLRLTPEQLSEQHLIAWFEAHAAGEGSVPALGRLRLAFQKGRPFRDLEIPVIVAGRRRWWALAGRPLIDDCGSDQGWRGVISDITLEREAYARVDHLARYDSLTGLANRTYLRDRLQMAIEASGQRPAALLCMDMDNFKWVNDRFGHAIGDQVLRDAGRRLQSLVRGKDLVARAGGDEFALLLDDVARSEDALALGQRIVQELGSGFLVSGCTIRAGVSVGIVLIPEHGGSVDELLANADLALGASKAGGRGRCELFRADLGERLRLRVALEADLRQAVPRGELRLHWQPQVDTGAWRVSGFEALVRWQHPTLGLVPPMQFIPVAEESGLIVDIGTWVLQEACRVGMQQLREMTIAVNASPIQIVHDQFVDTVRHALGSTGLPAHRLEIEITESLFIDASPKALANLETLRRIGVRIALDDFGTGYSSLAYLRQFPFDTLKIDRAFVRELVTQHSTRAIVRSIMDLARALGMSTLAEGVEEPAQYELLRRAGCDSVQGFLIARPMPIDEALALLGSWSLQHAPQASSVPDSVFAEMAESSSDPTDSLDSLPPMDTVPGDLLH